MTDFLVINELYIKYALTMRHNKITDNYKNDFSQPAKTAGLLVPVHVISSAV